MNLKLEIFPLIILCTCASVCLASLTDDPKTLEEGEYAHSYITLVDSEELYVIGGGAERIEAKDSSYVEVQYTSSNNSIYDIYDIFLGDNSELLHLNGFTQEITVGNDAIADLKGGTISSISIYHGPTESCYVTIYCQKGYTKTDSGISGLWANGTSFDIGFNDSGPYITAPYVNVEIIPEPTTLALFGLGGFLIRKRMS